jgi:hypothetical protein
VTIRLTFDSTTLSADVARRTITALIAPWGKVGRHSNGRRWRFERGSLLFAHAKYLWLNEDHSQGLRFARAVDAQDTDEGLVMTFAVKEGPHGDRMLALAAQGVKAGFSPEIEIDGADLGPDPANPGVTLVRMAHLTGVGMLKNPAFTDTRVIAVAMSYTGGTMDTCPQCGAQLTDGVAHTCTPSTDPSVTPAVPAAPAPAPAAATPAPAAPAQVTFSADQLAAFLEAARTGTGGTPAPAAPAARPVVDPTAQGNPATPPAQVTEPLPYRFSYEELPGGAGGKTVFHGGEHDFSTDLMTIVALAQQHRDYSEPLNRVNALIRAAFDVDTADVTAVNPNRHRPDMWVRQRDYRTVLWDMIAAGTTDGTKFDVPKFSSASGLVGAATEGTEPAPGAFAATLQTITPTQVWGKVEITRQAWRAGGSPQLSGILWDQMLREYYEDREAAVATFLNTLTAAADITLTGTPAATPDNDDDQVTANDLEAAIAMLQFDRGGDQISAFAVHRDLYKVLARVTDDAGRKLYPIINPTNASGSAQPRFRTMNIAGVTAVGSYALGASGTAATNSWLFDPATVYGWAGAPERLFWDFGATVQTANIPQLSYVTLGIYGDIALANTDINGVRQVIFDPSV